MTLQVFFIRNYHRHSGLFCPVWITCRSWFVSTRSNWKFCSNVLFKVHNAKSFLDGNFGCNKGCKSHNFLIYTLICGERGIRTPGTSRYGSFQDCCNRPLYHLSCCKVRNNDYWGQTFCTEFARIWILHRSAWLKCDAKVLLYFFTSKFLGNFFCFSLKFSVFWCFTGCFRRKLPNGATLGKICTTLKAVITLH